MKKMTLIVAAAIALAAPAAFAAMDHESMPMDHGNGSMKMKHDGMMSMGKIAHEEVVDGVKATFEVLDIQQKMKEMGMKETHHIMVMFTDAKTKKMLDGGEAKIKVIAPDKSEQAKDLMGMEGGFGSDFTMPMKGKYGVMCKFQLKDGKVRSAKFWYTVK
jgi:Spy/CpxP family protein refolding chaperone